MFPYAFPFAIYIGILRLKKTQKNKRTIKNTIKTLQFAKYTKKTLTFNDISEIPLNNIWFHPDFRIFLLAHRISIGLAMLFCCEKQVLKI